MGPWLVYAALLNSATIALFEGSPLGTEFCSFVEKAHVTMLGIVPSLARVWYRSGVTDAVDWSRIRFVLFLCLRPSRTLIMRYLALLQVL